MNLEDKDLDQLFRESAKEYTVPFKEEFWAEMEALLPKEDKRKLGIWFWSTAASVAVLLSVGSWAIWNHSAEKVSEHQTASIEKEHAKNTESISKKTISTPKTTEVHTNELNVSNSTNGISPKINTQKKSVQKYTVPNTPQVETENFVFSELVENTEVNDEGIRDLNVKELDPFEFTALHAPTNFNFPSSVKKSKKSIYFEAFGGVAQSLTQGDNASPTANYGVGVGAQISKKNFAFRTGLALRVLHTNDVEIKRNSKVYSFTSTQFQQNLNYSQLYFIDLPIQVAYLKGKQAFVLGLSPSILMSSRLKYETQQNNELTDKGNSWNQNLGLNRFHLNAQIGYELEVYENWALGARISSSLIHPLEKEVFNNQLKSMPLQASLTLKHSL